MLWRGYFFTLKSEKDTEINSMPSNIIKLKKSRNKITMIHSHEYVSYRL